LRDGVGRRQLAIAGGFARRARRLGQITEQLSFGLLERGAVGTGIDLEQDLTGGYLITFGELNMQDGAVHLRPHIHRTKWLDRPVCAQLVRDGPALHARDADGDLGSRPAAL